MYIPEYFMGWRVDDSDHRADTITPEERIVAAPQARGRKRASK
jgi:hypothetical protein